MAIYPRLGASPELPALLILSTVFFALVARAAPAAENTPAFAEIAPRPADCSGPREEDPRCALRGPGSATRPVEPIMPPVTPPGFPPKGPPVDLESAPYIFGWAKASLHIKDENQDVTYESDRVWLLFAKRGIQDMPGNTQYVLSPAPTGHGGEFAPLSMTWIGKGRVFDCTIEGQAMVTFPIDVDPNSGHGIIPGLSTPLDPARPAYGYLNIVGPDGGDFHSVIVSAFNPNARLKQTCPRNPPTVTEVISEAGYLLHILWRKNMYEEGRLVLSGMQVYDAGKPDDFLNLLPPGPGRDLASRALSQAQVSTSRTSRQYIWEWSLFPVSGFR